MLRLLRTARVYRMHWAVFSSREIGVLVCDGVRSIDVAGSEAMKMCRHIKALFAVG